MVRMWMVLGLLVGCSGATDGETDGPTDNISTDDTGSAVDCEPDVCGSCAPEVAVGGGRDVFETRADGDGVVMVHGPQGGWHMESSVRAGHLGSLASIHYTIVDDDSGVTVADNTYNVALVEDPANPCFGEYLAMYGYLDVGALAVGEMDTPPELLAGNTLTITMEVGAPGETPVTVVQSVVAEKDPIDEIEE